jgi:outer membrane protein assembly factor BamB
MRRLALTILLCLLAAHVCPCNADDWPRWLGPTANGVYREQGIVETVPVAGLKVNWRVPVAGGYAGPAVVGNRVYLFDYLKSSGEVVNDPGQRAELKGSERLLCIDTASGKTIWKYEYDCPYSISYPAGPRCTPTLDTAGPNDPGRVYILGSEGDFTCLNAKSGELVWKRNFKMEYSAPVPMWGFSAHPLVAGDLVYCMVGGPGQTVVAFDKLTGQERWKALSATGAGYCPPSMIEVAGVRQLMVWHSDAIVGMDPLSGKELWNVPLKPDFEMSIARPQVEGNRIFASAIRNHSVLFELSGNGRSPVERWRGEPKNSVYSANSTPIFHGGVIYGTDCNEGSLIAVNADSGERLWTTFQATKPDEKRRVNHGTAFITHLEGSDRYLLMSESGDLILAKMTAAGYQELWRFHVLEPTGEAFGRNVVWSHPAYAQKTAFARNDKELVSVRIGN